MYFPTDALPLSETKVKGEGEQEWEGERVIVSGVPDRFRAHEGVAVVIKRRLWGSIIKYNCVSPRMLWVKLKVAG